ncbi:MAG: uroporphyrinogen-III synthase [Alphaproteobacteria bacterium]
MRVLVTRPWEDAEAVVALLAARGIEGIVAPLLAIVPRDASIDLAGAQAVLLTSANGARMFARLTARRDILVLAVGAVTGATAREQGFADVRVAGGDVIALAALAATLDPVGGTLVHVAGTNVAGDLAGELARRGFTVRRAVIYDAVPAPDLPDAAREALTSGTIDAVLLFSPRTAATFLALVRKARLEASLGGLDAVCLSEAVAAEARAARWRAVRVAPRPDTEALIDLLAARP